MVTAAGKRFLYSGHGTDPFGMNDLHLAIDTVKNSVSPTALW